MKMNRWTRLAIAAVIQLFAGVVYAWSVLKAPLAEEFGWGSAILGLNYTVSMCCFALGGMTAGLISKKLSARWRLLIPAAAILIGFIGVSRLGGASPLPLYILYGIFCGFSIGMVYTTVITTPVAWFPDRTGLCSGITMMAFGLSALIMGKIVSKLFDLPGFGWRKTYVLVGIAAAAVCVAGSFIIRLPREGEVPPAAQKKKSDIPSLSSREMLGRPSFYLTFLFFILYCSVGCTVFSFARDYAISLGVGESAAVTLVGLLSVANGLGRLFSGWFLDKKGLRPSQFLMSAIVLLATLLGAGAVWLASLPMGVCAMVLVGVSYGFSPTISAGCCMRFYGSEHYASNLSIMNMTLLPGSLVSTLSGKMVDATGSFLGPMLLLLAFSCVGTVINIFNKKA